jgi:hypothetical protein
VPKKLATKREPGKETYTGDAGASGELEIFTS